MQASYESYHDCKYTPEAIKAAVMLSTRYIPDRFLPDKAMDLIDEAGSKARIALFEARREQGLLTYLDYAVKLQQVMAKKAECVWVSFWILTYPGIKHMLRNCSIVGRLTFSLSPSISTQVCKYLYSWKMSQVISKVLTCDSENRCMTSLYSFFSNCPTRWLHHANGFNFFLCLTSWCSEKKLQLQSKQETLDIYRPTWITKQGIGREWS